MEAPSSPRVIAVPSRASPPRSPDHKSRLRLLLLYLGHNGNTNCEFWRKPFRLLQLRSARPSSLRAQVLSQRVTKPLPQPSIRPPRCLHSLHHPTTRPYVNVRPPFKRGFLPLDSISAPSLARSLCGRLTNSFQEMGSDSMLGFVALFSGKK